jgi:hypothetical protein
MKAITYKDHTIEKDAPGEGIYSILGGAPGYTVRGPHVYHGCSPTLRGAKGMVDNAIKRAALKKAKT